MEEDQHLRIGSRVRVFSADKKIDLGYGTYMGDVLFRDALNEPVAPSLPPLTEKDRDPFFTDEVIKRMVANGHVTPKIVLDNSEIVFGYQCRWRQEESGQSTHAH